MEHPHMIRALSLTTLLTISAAFWASPTVMSGPPTTRIKAPLACLQVDLSQHWRGKCLMDRCLDPVVGVLVGLADTDECHTALVHDGLDIGIVQVDQARLGDDLGQTLNGLHQDLVCDLERRFDRQLRDHLQELVVRHHDGRVADLPQLVQIRTGRSPCARSLRP